MKSLSIILLITLLTTLNNCARYDVARRVKFRILGAVKKEFVGTSWTYVDHVPTSTNMGEDEVVINFVGSIYDGTELNPGEIVTGNTATQIALSEVDDGAEIILSRQGRFTFSIPYTDTRQFTNGKYASYLDHMTIKYSAPFNDYFVYFRMKVIEVQMKQFSMIIKDNHMYNIFTLQDVTTTDESSSDESDIVSVNSVSEDDEPSPPNLGDGSQELATVSVDGDSPISDRKLSSRKVVMDDVLKHMSEFFDHMAQKNKN